MTKQIEAEPKAKSRLLEAVHETAADLHRLGFIDEHGMRKYEALYLGASSQPEYNTGENQIAAGPIQFEPNCSCCGTL
ncbi:hypothetical protein [Pigmentiphaga soli]|uniref:hypothetical protein n=1 Tax=Pigmentiphaga soli TaxID=1007095 RepID=UPI0031EF0FDE